MAGRHSRRRRRGRWPGRRADYRLGRLRLGRGLRIEAELPVRHGGEAEEGLRARAQPRGGGPREGLQTCMQRLDAAGTRREGGHPRRVAAQEVGAQHQQQGKPWTGFAQGLDEGRGRHLHLALLVLLLPLCLVVARRPALAALAACRGRRGRQQLNDGCW